MNASKNVRATAALVSSMALAGCVWQSDYDRLQAQNDQLRDQIATEQARVGRLQGAIQYTVESDLLFAPGGWTIRERGKHVMADMAAKLASTQQNKRLVTGYTDNSPVGPGSRREGINPNSELSHKRADMVLQFLMSQVVKPELLTAQGAGE